MRPSAPSSRDLAPDTGTEAHDSSVPTKNYGDDSFALPCSPLGVVAHLSKLKNSMELRGRLPYGGPLSGCLVDGCG